VAEKPNQWLMASGITFFVVAAIQEQLNLKNTGRLDRLGTIDIQKSPQLYNTIGR